MLRKYHSAKPLEYLERSGLVIAASRHTQIVIYHIFMALHDVGK